jgi:hypothetical protein
VFIFVQCIKLNPREHQSEHKYYKIKLQVIQKQYYICCVQMYRQKAMHKLSITLNAVKVGVPTIEVSAGFEDEIIGALKKHTSIDLEVLTCRRVRYRTGTFNMVRYSFDNLSEDKLIEFEEFSKRLCMAFSEAINHNLN